MSDTENISKNSASEKLVQSAPSKLSLNEVQHFRKAEIIAELRKRGIEVDENTYRDILRAELVSIVKLENSRTSEEQQETVNITSSTGTQNVNTQVSETASGSNQNRENTQNTETPEYVTSDSENSGDSMENTKIYFYLETGDWEAFTERLELHFVVKKITEPDMKRAMLLTHVDEETYKLFKNLCAPAKPISKSYDELITLLTQHINPTPSEVMERCVFNRAKQEQNETIAEFSTRLRHLALNCNFSEQLKTALRDQFVCGIYDESTRIELFKQTSLTFESALKEATARESAMKNAAGAHKTLSQKNFQQESFAMSQTYQRKTETNKNSGAHANNNNTQPDEKPERNKLQCYCCGENGHKTHSCNFRDRVCNFCKTKGHLERACIKNRRGQTNLSKKRTHPGKQTTTRATHRKTTTSIFTR